MDDSENLVTDNAEMCEMLGEQHVSAYNVPLPNFALPSNDKDLNSSLHIPGKFEQEILHW